jgi:hypothetical protein
MLHLYQTIDLCLNCKQNMDEPKLLPCGYTICTCCEKKIMSIYNDYFDCSLCGNTHAKDNNALPVNHSLKKLKKVYLTSNYQKLVNKMKNIDEIVANLEDNMESKIKSHCENLRYQVDLSTESEIESLNLQIEILNKNREEMLDTINKFEKKKISEVQKYVKEECEQSTAILINEFETLKTELQKNNEDNCEKIIEQANGLKNKLEEQNNKIDQIYKTGLLYFHEPNMNIGDKIIGTLDKIPIMDAMMENLKLVGKNNIDYNIKYRNISEPLAAVNNNCYIAIVLKYYCYDSVTYKKQENIELKVYFNNKELRSQIVDSHVYENIYISDSIIYLMYKNLSYGIYGPQPNTFTTIDSYDLDSLNVNNSITLPFESSKIFCQENKLFVISRNEPCISIFSGNLEHIESFGSSNDPYYIKSNQIFIKNGFFFTQNGENIKILKEKNGKLHKEFYLQPEDQDNIVWISHSLRIITFNGEYKTIRAYNLDGEMISEFQISNIEEISSIDISENGRILINDKKNCILYYN